MPLGEQVSLPGAWGSFPEEGMVACVGLRPHGISAGGHSALDEKATVSRQFKEVSEEVPCGL